MGSDFGNPLRKFKLVFLGEQSGESDTIGFNEPINLSTHACCTRNTNVRLLFQTTEHSH